MRHALLVLVLGTSLVDRIHCLEIRLQEFDVAPICQARIFVLRDLLLDIEIALAEGVQYSQAKVGGICDVVDFIHIDGYANVNKILETGELNMCEALLNRDCTKRFTICPDISVRYT